MAFSGHSSQWKRKKWIRDAKHSSLPIGLTGVYPCWKWTCTDGTKTKNAERVENKTGTEGFFRMEILHSLITLPAKPRLSMDWHERPARRFLAYHLWKGLSIKPFAVDIIKWLLFQPCSNASGIKFPAKQPEVYSKSEKELAGITCYQSERFNYVFGITKGQRLLPPVAEEPKKVSQKLLPVP